MKYKIKIETPLRTIITSEPMELNDKDYRDLEKQLKSVASGDFQWFSIDLRDRIILGRDVLVNSIFTIVEVAE
jgi:hypothetical protein